MSGIILPGSILFDETLALAPPPDWNNYAADRGNGDAVALVADAFTGLLRPANWDEVEALSAVNADKARPTYAKPRVWGYNNHGCIFDVVLGVNDSSLSLDFAPIPIFSGNKIYFLIDNLLASNIIGICSLSYLG